MGLTIPPAMTPATAGARIGVFGGAFDPPHRAHRALAEAALAQLALDALHIVPTGEAWHKNRVLSDADHRLAMARLAFGDLPHVHIDDQELRRTGPSYTIDTLHALQAIYPGCALYLILGEDQARALPTWHAWQAICQIAIISIAQRPGIALAKGTIGTENGTAARFQPLQTTPTALSATAIRSLVASGQRVDHLVSEPVARYIDQHHLYQTTR